MRTSTAFTQRQPTPTRSSSRSLSSLQTGKDSGWGTGIGGTKCSTIGGQNSISAREEVAFHTSTVSQFIGSKSFSGFQPVRHYSNATTCILPQLQPQGPTEACEELQPNATSKLNNISLNSTMSSFGLDQLFHSHQDPLVGNSSNRISNDGNRFVPAFRNSSTGSNNTTHVSPTPTATSVSGFSGEETSMGFRMPPPRNGSEYYNLRPQRFVNGVEVIHRENGSKLVDRNGYPMEDSQGRPVINENGFYVGYTTGNYRVDRNGVRIV